MEEVWLEKYFGTGFLVYLNGLTLDEMKHKYLMWGLRKDILFYYFGKLREAIPSWGLWFAL